MNKKEKDFTGFPGDCSEKQLVVLEKVKEKAYSDLGLTSPPYDDAYLLRFCRARKFEIEKVMIMLEAFLQWRKDNNVDDVDFFSFEELE